MGFVSDNHPISPSRCLNLELWGRSVKNLTTFSWFGHDSKSRVVNSELDPVLLVPGIVGSILDAVNKKDGSSERVWVRMLMASCQFKKKLWAIYNPETGE